MISSKITPSGVDSIVRILTLRYDPLAPTVMAPLSADDFGPTKEVNSEGLSERIVKIIEGSLTSMGGTLKRASVSLSAGVDSGMTLVMLRKFLPDVKLDCISVGFGEEDDETARAQEIARKYDCNFKEVLVDDVLVDLPLLISVVGEPRWNLYTYYSLREAKKTSNAFFAGDGGDELFGGYTFRYSKFLSLISNGAGWPEKVKSYLECHERDWVPDQARLFGSKASFSWDSIYSVLKPYFDNSLAPIDQVFLADFNGKLLHDWMPANKAFEKFLEMEIKSIFLTEQMIKFATHVPWQLKFDPSTGLGKMPLRAILASHKGFENIQPIKKGFSINLTSMWNKRAKEVISSYVNKDSEVVKAGIISSEWISGVYNTKLENDNKDHAPDPRYIGKLFSILALEVWYRLFVTCTLGKDDKL